MSDPSLRWYPLYRKSELVVYRGEHFRFHAYADDAKETATLENMAMGELPGIVKVSELCRPTLLPESKPGKEELPAKGLTRSGPLAPRCELR